MEEGKDTTSSDQYNDKFPPAFKSALDDKERLDDDGDGDDNDDDEDDDGDDDASLSDLVNAPSDEELTTNEKGRNEDYCSELNTSEVCVCVSG